MVVTQGTAGPEKVTLLFVSSDYLESQVTCGYLRPICLH